MSRKRPVPARRAELDTFGKNADVGSGLVGAEEPPMFAPEEVSPGLTAARAAFLARQEAGARLVDAADVVQAAQEALALVVTEARAAGVSWADVGAIVGLSAEGARSRWGRRA